MGVAKTWVLSDASDYYMLHVEDVTSIKNLKCKEVELLELTDNSDSKE